MFSRMSNDFGPPPYEHQAAEGEEIMRFSKASQQFGHPVLIWGFKSHRNTESHWDQVLASI